MSLVLEVLRGVLAIRVPATILSPSFTTMCAPEGIGIIGHELALIVQDDDLRMQIFLVFDDDHGFLAGGFVHFLLHGDALDDVVRTSPCRPFRRESGRCTGSHWTKVSPFLTLPPSGDGNDRADDDGVDFQLAAIVGRGWKWSRFC